MAHFAQRFRLDLANPLAGNSKLAADLFQGPAISVDQAEALFENLAFTFGQRLKHILDLFLQQHNRRHVAGVFSTLVFDEVAEIRLLAFANRISSATSSGVGSRPYSWTNCFCTRISLLIVSIIWTGMRMVRA